MKLYLSMMGIYCKVFILPKVATADYKRNNPKKVDP